MRPWLAAAVVAAALPTGARGADPSTKPAVARPQFAHQSETGAGATVFFLSAPGETGAVAVGAAHSFDLTDLAQSAEVRFVLGHSRHPVAVSSRFYTAPGRPYLAAGSSIAEDFVVFALDLAPDGVRLLDADPRGRPERGERVRVLGVPTVIPRDDDDIFGTVELVTDERLEVDLDVPEDLRGWGGGPLISLKTNRVVGVLEAAWPSGGTLRVAAAPIGAVTAAMRKPLDGGLGRPFADFDPKPGSNRAAPGRDAKPRAPTGAAPGRSTERPAKTLFGDVTVEKGELSLEIEYPPDGAVLGDPVGAFVAGRALAPIGDFRRIDVVFVIDTSQSTVEPTGADINGNGVVGKPRIGGIGALFGIGSTDPGDSILAAEVASARHFLRGLDPRSTRIALVTFAGEPPESGGLFSAGRSRAAAITEVPLTRHYDEIEYGLERVLKTGPAGNTHMAAGVDQATIELLGLTGALSQSDPRSEKFVIFLTDGEPTLPYSGFLRDNVRAVIRAANRAARADVRIHSFAIGPQALKRPIAPVEMAARTDGVFTPVRHPAELSDVIEQVRFVNLESVEVRNLTTGAPAQQIATNADGSWTALVPLEAGANRIEAVATATGGKQVKREFSVHYAPGSPGPYVPEDLIARRNRLLEQRLVELKRERIEAERLQAEQTRRELLLEIDRERAAAKQRAEQQRKKLDLEPEIEDETAAQGPR
ncbi:MAG: VWA domain-containing protein [Deltaproteobacteria bacterium]|nr:MAG: VWA domain-containing protein [Deltaproteobacteria bacterium]